MFAIRGGQTHRSVELSLLLVAPTTATIGFSEWIDRHIDRLNLLMRLQFIDQLGISEVDQYFGIKSGLVNVDVDPDIGTTVLCSDLVGQFNNEARRTTAATSRLGIELNLRSTIRPEHVALQSFDHQLGPLLGQPSPCLAFELEFPNLIVVELGDWILEVVSQFDEHLATKGLLLRD